MGRLSKYDSAFKDKVAMEAMKERESLSELAKRFNVSPTKITQWKE